MQQVNKPQDFSLIAFLKDFNLFKEAGYLSL